MPPETPPRGPSQFSKQFALALELPFVLVCAVVLGGAAGYFLDRWLNTAPLLLILLGLLGFVGGLREMMRRIRMIEKK